MQKQINISIPQEWFGQLERLARMYSVQEDRTLSHLDLIRSALQEKYNLNENTADTKTDQK